MKYFLVFLEVQATPDSPIQTLNALSECENVYPNIKKAEDSVTIFGMIPHYVVVKNIIELSKEQYIAAGGEIEGN